MATRKPVIHARDHGHGGADPVHIDLIYDTVVFDTDTMANLAGDARILTVHTAGLYLVVCQTVFAFNTTGRRINTALQNGYYSAGGIPVSLGASDTRNTVSTGSGRTNCTSIGIFQAAVGDYFSSGAYQASGTSLAINGFPNTFLSALLIGV
jgi:hypothetical protein